jgi:hypothetical protein
MEFVKFPKIARFNREVIVTEKIDGMNAQIKIVKQTVENDELFDWEWTCQIETADACVYTVYVGVRNGWVSKTQDNFGLAGWVYDHAHELVKLGEGTHSGEWWGKDIHRGYGLRERRFSLFNVSRWASAEPGTVVLPNQTVAPACCHVVPVLARGTLNTLPVERAVGKLTVYGSIAAPGYSKPEGVVVYHTAADTLFKLTLDNDGMPKSAAKLARTQRYEERQRREAKAQASDAS